MPELGLITGTSRERRGPIFKLTFEVRRAAQAQVSAAAGVTGVTGCRPRIWPREAASVSVSEMFAQTGTRPVFRLGGGLEFESGPPTQNASESLNYSLIYSHFCSSSV